MKESKGLAFYPQQLWQPTDAELRADYAELHAKNEILVSQILIILIILHYSHYSSGIIKNN